jgi:hypothetical protein
LIQLLAAAVAPKWPAPTRAVTSDQRYEEAQAQLKAAEAASISMKSECVPKAVSPRSRGH